MRRPNPAALRIPSLFGLLLFCGGCLGVGPAVYTSRQGNVEIHVVTPEDVDPRLAEIRIDGLPVGNAGSRLPLLQLRRGEHRVSVEVPGFPPQERTIYVLGEPNRQVLYFLFGETPHPGGSSGAPAGEHSPVSKPQPEPAGGGEVAPPEPREP